MQKPRQKSLPLVQRLDVWITDHLTRVPFVEKMLFVHHLQIMTRAGLSIVSALKVLSEEIANKKLKKIIVQVKLEVEKGRQLSEVLSDYPKIFPEVYVSMIAAGESSGKLEESLEQVSYQMKQSNELNSRIRGALIYPAVILTAMVGISIEVVFFVLPKVMIMFEEFNAELPLPTKILIFIVKGAENYGLWMLIGIIALIVFIRWFIKKPEIRKTLHRITLRLPIFGAVAKKINLARFTLTLSSLLRSGIPIIEAARITADV
ncbi:MAG: type II secretion system F family protein, partial [Candidatus Komeilibacteria bacterium]|nr:type II secretion system F family protein [Candidatus Komeilibacteria bacterium]